MNYSPQAKLVSLSPCGEPVSAVRRTDELLLVAREAAKGSSTAVRTLVMHVGPAILMTVRKILGSTHPDVDDVAQDAVIALLDALATFRGESSVMTFAHRVALLTALAARRKNATRQKYLNVVALEQPAETHQASPQSLLLAKRRREVLLRLLDDLPDTTAEALALHFVLGMTVEEIAAVANAPENTIWSRLRLGKQALRKRLSADSQVAALLGEAE
ncbi:MAG: RNA polymerase sigma factor [Polyangiaceae bacterium]